MNRIIFSLFISGLLLGSGPCLATCGPVLISYVVATRQNPKQGILVWLLFSLSRICVYLILSIGVFRLGEFLLRQNLMYIANYVYLLGGIIIVLVGTLTIVKDLIKPASTYTENIDFERKESSSHADNISVISNEFGKSTDKFVGNSCDKSDICSIGATGGAINRLLKIQPITLGLIIGFLPCAPLLAVLSYIGLISFNWRQSVFYSLVFGIGTLISPLILLVLGAGAISKILLNKPKIYHIFRFICGLIIILFGLQLILRYAQGQIVLP